MTLVHIVDDEYVEIRDLLCPYCRQDTIPVNILFTNISRLFVSINVMCKDKHTYVINTFNPEIVNRVESAWIKHYARK